MSAYEKLASSGTEVSLKALEAEYFKVKKEHRGVYDSQKDQLMAILEMPQNDKQKKNAKTTQNRVDTSKQRLRLNANSTKKTEQKIRSMRNHTASNSVTGKLDAAKRKAKHVNKYSEEEYNYKNRRTKRKKESTNIFTDPNEI